MPVPAAGNVTSPAPTPARPVAGKVATQALTPVSPFSPSAGNVGRGAVATMPIKWAIIALW
jgi:hypothetical protein